MYTHNTAWKYIEIHNTLHILYCVCVLCIRPLVCVAYYILCIMYCVCVLFICCECHSQVVDVGQVCNFCIHSLVVFPNPQSPYHKLVFAY